MDDKFDADIGKDGNRTDVKRTIFFRSNRSDDIMKIQITFDF